MADRTYSGDFEYFHGSWQNGQTFCWMCNTGPGATAAVLASLRVSGAKRYLQLASDTFSDAIHHYQQLDGGFPNPANPSAGNEIPTIFFGVELGESYLVLRSQLSSATRQLWIQAMAKAAKYLVKDQNVLTFYSNGNLQLQVAEFLYDAWQATGSTSFERDYNREWSFMEAPPQSRWPGFGLIITRQPTEPSGADGAGYLAESGGGTPGYDADYTQLQLDEATRLYVLSGDPRALRLTNLLLNQELERTTSAWLLNTSGGSRHPQPNRYIPFSSPALAVLGWLTPRTGLQGDILGELNEDRSTMCGALTYESYNLFRSMGNEVSVLLLAAAHASAASAGLLDVPTTVCPNIPLPLRKLLVN